MPQLGLNIRVKPRKRIPVGKAKPLLQPIQANACWSMDFMSDALCCGRKFRTFNVMDDYNREALLVRVGATMPAVKVIQLLDCIAAVRCYPEMIRVDNVLNLKSRFFCAAAKNYDFCV